MVTRTRHGLLFFLGRHFYPKFIFDFQDDILIHDLYSFDVQADVAIKKKINKWIKKCYLNLMYSTK